MKEKAEFSMPASNVGSGPAVTYLHKHFGPGKWDKPPQIAALLDGLIVQTEAIRAVWQEEKPTFPSFTDPAGTWLQEDRELARALRIYRAMREEVGRVSGSNISDPDVTAPIRDALLYGTWDFYDETGIPKPDGVKPNDSLPLAGLPYRVAAAMDAVIKHDHEIFIKWVQDDLPASVEEGFGTVGEFVGKTAGSVATGAGSIAASTTKGIFSGLWDGMSPPVRAVGLGLGALWIWKTFFKETK